ncbi:5'-methylthioadenosine phosphorylase [Candidatus Woesearchaeota archaeon]|nr:5'-methylthioadenosine phosphorylase [Candidatus Woesearchaeota archaeon]
MEKIAFICGSGLSDALDFLLTGVISHSTVETPYGLVLPHKIGNYGDTQVVLLPRHGEQDGKPVRSPAELVRERGYEANIWRLHNLGIEHVYAFSAVGALDLDIPLASEHTFLVPDRAMRGFAASQHSFGSEAKIVHMGLDGIFDRNLQTRVVRAIQETGCTALENGLYIYNGGDVFESTDEVATLKEMTRNRKSPKVLGMTIVPEGILCAQMEMPFVAICSNVNYASGLVSGAVVDHQETRRIMAIARGDIVRITQKILESY